MSLPQASIVSISWARMVPLRHASDFVAGYPVSLMNPTSPHLHLFSLLAFTTVEFFSGCHTFLGLRDSC